MIIDLMVDEALLRVRLAVVVAAIEGKVMRCIPVTSTDKSDLRVLDEMVLRAEERTRAAISFTRDRSRRFAGELQVSLGEGDICRVKALGRLGDVNGQHQRIFDWKLLNGLDALLADGRSPPLVRDAIRIYWAAELAVDRADVVAALGELVAKPQEAAMC